MHKTVQHIISARFNAFFSLQSIVIVYAISSFSQSADFKGQISGWTSQKLEKPWYSIFGVRYIPDFYFISKTDKKFKVDADISMNLFGTTTIRSFESFGEDGKMKPYRLWIRLSSNQFEARLGLQKINFGPARFIRPLMWFDQIDPRDPLQITDGVYALLLRYYTLNNTTFWLWGLYGNTRPKGWELLSTREKSPEFGGRIQFPVPVGEVGLSYHHRIQDTTDSFLSYPADTKHLFPENRIGIDGRWDLGIGLWFEGVLYQSNISIPELRYTKMATLGLDYTFKWGNGPGVTSEQLLFSNSVKAFDFNNSTFFSTVSLNYPLTLVWSATAIIYYDWNHKDFYRFLNLTLAYDKWSFYFMGFWNPEKFLIYRNTENNIVFTGKSIQFMAVFNY